MTIKELKNIISSLARCQGFYSRLYRDLEEWKNWGELKNYCNKNKINNAVDLCIALEW
jgi:hypothetical protein